MMVVSMHIGDIPGTLIMQVVTATTVLIVHELVSSPHGLGLSLANLLIEWLK